MRGLRLVAGVGLALLVGCALLTMSGTAAPRAGDSRTLLWPARVVEWAAAAFTADYLNRIESDMHSGRIIIGQQPPAQAAQAQPAGGTLAPGDLLVREVALISHGGPVEAPEGIVYSTQPRTALDLDGNHYVTKGTGDVGMVVAELVGYKLAELLKIPVPGFGVGRFGADGEPLFVSEMVGDAQRDVAPWLKKKLVTNGDAVLRLLALDVWIANNDRNMGGLLGRPVQSEPGKIEIVAIDFEKAQVVRHDTPLVGIPLMNPKAFWPTGTLGKLCREVLNLDVGIVTEFAGFTDGQVGQVVDSCVAAVGDGFTRRDSVCFTLRKRLAKLTDLVKEAWA